MHPSRLVFLAIVLFLGLAAQAGLMPGPERPIAPPAYGPAFGTQYPQALATDGTDFLAVWLDQQPGREGLYAAVLTKEGVTRPLPPRPIVRGYVNFAHAIWVGDAYLVLWYDTGTSYAAAARVSRDGRVLSLPVVIASGFTHPRSVAWNGRHALVMLSRQEGPNALLLDAQARVVRDDLFIGSHDPSNETVVVAAGESFVAATILTRFVIIAGAGWPHSRVSLSRLSSDGDREDSIALVPEMPNHAVSLSAAAEGNGVGIAFIRRGQTVDDRTYLMRYTVDAGTLDVTAHPPMIARGDSTQVVSTPGGFTAGSLQYIGSTLSLATISFTGSSWNATSVGPERGADLRMISSGTAVTAVWRDYRHSSPVHGEMQMFGVALDASAIAPTREVAPVALSAVRQTDPMIAPAGGQALVVWLDLPTTARGSVVARRIDRDGSPIDAQPLVLSASASRWSPPRVVFTGRVWIVAWIEESADSARSVMRRIARDGTLLDAAPIELEGAGPFASNGSITLMATTLAQGIGVMRFSSDGEKLDAHPLLAVDRDGYLPALATNGSEFLLAWVEGSDYWQFPSPNYRDVHALRLDGNGAPIAAVIDVATGKDDEAMPAIASDGSDFLVIYQHLGDSTTVRAKRVLENGALADTTAAADGTVVGEGEYPFAVTPLRSGYAVLFMSLQSPMFSTSVVVVDPRGVPAEEPRVIAESEAPPTGSSLATMSGSVVAAYTRTAAEPAFANIVRVFVRKLVEETTRRRSVRR